MQRNTGYFPTESLEPCGNRPFSRSALNEGYLFRGSLEIWYNNLKAAAYAAVRVHCTRFCARAQSFKNIEPCKAAWYIKEIQSKQVIQC